MSYTPLLLGAMIFIPSAAVVAWIAQMEIDKYSQEMDWKITSEVNRRREIDESLGADFELPEIRLIRQECKKENRIIFLILFLASLVSFFGGSIFILNSSFI